MPRRTVRALAAAATLASIVSLSGCGVSDAPSARPGAAVEVGDSTLSMRTVDDVVDGFCSFAARSKGNPQSRTGFRSLVAVIWAQAEAVRVLAPKYGVALPEGDPPRASVEELFGPGATADAESEALTWITRQQGLAQQPIIEIGRKVAAETSDAPVSDQEAGTLGLATVVDWLKANDLQLNPVLGTVNLDDLRDAFGNNDLSVPVSKDATATDTIAKLDGLVASLPAEQRCGPAAPAAPAAG